MPAAERADITDLFTTFIQPKALPVLENALVLYRLGEPRPIPANSGDTTQVQWPDNLTSSTIPVNELSTGQANQLVWNTATMRVRFHANDIQFSKLVDLINMVGYRGESVNRLGFNAAETADLLARETLDDMTTNVQLVNDRAAVANFVATDTHNVDEMNQATTTLQVANATSHRLSPGAFVHVIASQVAGDVRGDTGGGTNPNALTWYDQNRRNDVSALENARIGRTMGLEVMVTSAIQRLLGGAAGTIAYYNNFVVADNLFMTGSIGSLPNAPDNRNAGNTLIDLIPPEVSQATPYGNRYIIAWHYYAAAGIQDDNRGVLLQAASGS